MTTPWTGPPDTRWGDGPIADKLREEHMRRRALERSDETHIRVVRDPFWKNPDTFPRCEAHVIEAGTATDRYGRPDGRVGHIECMDPAACAVEQEGSVHWMCWPHLVERAIYHKHRVVDAIAERSARCEACATPAKHLRSWGFACDWHNVEPKPATYRWGVAMGRCCAKDKLADGDCEVHKRIADKDSRPAIGPREGVAEPHL